MNDFTKEELEYLHRKFMLTNGDDFEHNLEAKLQSLIDNYEEDTKVKDALNYIVLKAREWKLKL